MRLFRFLTLTLMVTMVAVAAMAGPTVKDAVLTADGSVQFTTKLDDPSGPTMFDIAGNGPAWIKFIWFKSGTTSRAAADSATTIALSMVFQIRSYTPPRSFYFPSGPDSAYVDLVGATEVIISR